MNSSSMRAARRIIYLLHRLAEDPLARAPVSRTERAAEPRSAQEPGCGGYTRHGVRVRLRGRGVRHRLRPRVQGGEL